MKRSFQKWVVPVSLFLFTMSLCQGVALAQTAAATQATSPSGDAANATAATTDGAANLPSGAPRVRIGAGDLLDVKVFDVGELSQVVRVNDVGDATFLLIGTLHVDGMLPNQAQTLIARKLKEGHFVLDPQVSILIREYGTQGVSVLGEVRNPGVYQVLGTRTLLDVISQAGGTTPYAGPEVTIKRAIDGSTLSVRLTKNAQASLASDIQLEPGDKVIVPRAGIVYVLGDVSRPGGFIMQNDGKMSLLEAVAMAGGTTRTAALNHAGIIRKTAAGYTVIPIQVKKMMQGKKQDAQMQPEDILYVPVSAAKEIVFREAPSIAQSASSAAVWGAINP